MGSRRAHEEAAAAAARAAVIAGFVATSNLEAGRRFGLRTVGTAAHSFTLLHDTERDAFRAQLESLGPGTTLLVDTYDVEAAVRTAVELAGDKLGAVRLDSGDLVAQATWVRELLDRLGNVHTKIVVTSDLDEYSVAALRAAPADAYGIGTALVTGSGAPTAGMVYKLVSRTNDAGEFVAVAKSSKNKINVGGRKYAVRRLDGSGHGHPRSSGGRPPAGGRTPQQAPAAAVHPGWRASARMDRGGGCGAGPGAAHRDHGRTARRRQPAPARRTGHPHCLCVGSPPRRPPKPCREDCGPGRRVIAALQLIGDQLQQSSGGLGEVPAGVR